MTALAEINKGMLAVARLKGSDLEEFNEQHPRDAKGQFARVATAPVKDDPRIAREARRKRRQRRGLAEIVGQRAEAAREALNASSLQSLRRERVLPERKVQAKAKPVIDPRVKAKTKEPPKEKAKPEKGVKVDLTDESHANRSEGTTDVDDEVLIILPREQADEFFTAGSMNVDAAFRRWGVALTGHSTAGGEASVASRVMREQANFNKPYQHDMVALRISQRFRTTSSGEGQESFVLASSHVLTPTYPQPKNGIAFSDLIGVHENPGGVTQDDDYAPPSGVEVTIPVVDVEVHKAAAVMDWDDTEHPRDPDTGRFMHLRTGPGGPPGPVDPRIARARRHRRRQGRAMAEIAYRATEPEPEPRLVRDPRARSYAPPALIQREETREETRPTPSARTPLRDVGQRTAPKKDVESEPEWEAAGPEIRSWAGIYPRHNPKEQEEVRGTGKRRGGTKGARGKPLKSIATGTEPLDYSALEEVNLHWDENGDPTNLAEWQAYHTALKASRARKGSSKTS